MPELQGPPDPAPGAWQEGSNTLVLSYLAVRRSLGLLGLALPLSLLAWAGLSGKGVQPSISDFYHTPMGDIFVGTMCAIGVFLLAYRGYRPEPGEMLSDRWVSRIAGLAAIGVGIFPVQSKAACAQPLCAIDGLSGRWQTLHFASALVFFLCLAVFCLVLFPKSTGRARISERKRRANTIYRVCGWTILLALLGLIATFAAKSLAGPRVQATIVRHDLLFWLETLAVLAFAISWLTKGKTLAALRNVLPQGG